MAPTEGRSSRPISAWVDGKVFVLATIVTCVLGLVSVALVASASGDDRPSDRREEEVVVASGADRFPNSTAADWITYADHVVVGSVVDERRVPPAESELERGEGLVLRHLTIVVDDVLWSAPDQKEAAPSTFDWPALGWKFNTDPSYTETVMTGEHQPRLEVGGSYVFALDRPAGYCPDDAAGAPEWRGLGTGSVLPISSGIIGAGEFESRRITPAEAEAEWVELGAELPASLAGDGLAALATALSHATPDRAARVSARAEKCGVATTD